MLYDLPQSYWDDRLREHVEACLSSAPTFSDLKLLLQDVNFKRDPSCQCSISVVRELSRKVTLAMEEIGAQKTIRSFPPSR